MRIQYIDCRASLQQGAILSDLSLYCKNVLTWRAIRQLTTQIKRCTLAGICFQFMTDTKENEKKINLKKTLIRQHTHTHCVMM